MRTLMLCLTTLSLVAFAQANDPDGTKFKADDDMQKVLEALAAKNGKALETLTVEQARQQPTPTDAVKAVLQEKKKSTDPAELVKGVKTEDRMIPGASGEIAARVYTPEGKGPFPIVVYFHGGGWVIADKDVYDGGARGLAKEANAVVVSVDYRRAPEAKFPAQHDDALAAYKWVSENAASLNADPRKLALAGESAGGNLAVATAIGAKKAGLPMPLHVVSVYPIAQVTNLDTESYRDSANAKPLNKAMMQWFAEKALPGDAKKDWRVNLLQADLAGLPAVTIINAQIDPLRSDGEMLEKALTKAKVDVERRVYDGVTHEFFGMAAAVDDAKEAQAYAGKRLKAAFKSRG